MTLTAAPSGAIEIRDAQGVLVGTIQALDDGVRVFLGDSAAIDPHDGPSLVWSGEPFALTLRIEGALARMTAWPPL